jgi:hypothetical protein
MAMSEEHPPEAQLPPSANRCRQRPNGKSLLCRGVVLFVCCLHVISPNREFFLSRTYNTARLKFFTHPFGVRLGSPGVLTFHWPPLVVEDA